jgi:hypothetical protein
MSEHKVNPRAQLAATMPALLPPGVVAGVQLHLEVDVRQNVLLFPTERIRGDAGALEIFAKVQGVATDGTNEEEPEAWRAPPAGVIVHPIGTPLPPELCDVVLVLGTATQDTLDKPLLVPGGGVAAPRISSISHRVIMRMPLVEWQRQHMANLRGGVPS